LKKRRRLHLTINPGSYQMEAYTHDQWARDMLYRKFYRSNLNYGFLLNKIWQSLHLKQDSRAMAIDILFGELLEEA